MSNWDLMMPGMGLTAIGLAGVTISYAGIAHTFVDGMHALTGLTMFIGLIFLSAGILEGGVSTSNRAKATTLVILGISFSFGLAALNFNAITTIPTFAGVMLIVVVPAIVMAYVSMKMPQYAKPVSIIFVIAVGAAIGAYVGFGIYGPSQYLVPPQEEVIPEEPVSTAPVFAISILKGSATEGNPDYDPDVAHIPEGNIIEWTNNDDVSHTVTSLTDAGDTFNSGLIDAGATFRLDTAELPAGTYEYFCMVHPWMAASFVLGEGGAVLGAPEFPISILLDSSIQGNPDYDPDFAQIPQGNIIVWTNNDNTMHTATSTADPPAFDSDFLNARDTFRLDTSNLAIGTYEYICLVHPWMQASFEIVASDQRVAEGAIVSEPVPPEEPPVSEMPVEEPPQAEEIPVEEPVATPQVEETPVEEPSEESTPTEEPATTQIEKAPVEEPIEEPQATAEEPTPNSVSISQGASSPGCEATDECFIPSSITVQVGTTVTWTNDDSAAHTVTSGQDATFDGIFDSGLFMAGRTYQFTFEDAGTYPYFCFVHPWMKGTVIVE